VPLGTGLAFRQRYRGNDSVSLTYFGDGAANQGQVYESFNMAKLWKLPVIYVIENNKYAMGTSVARARPPPTVASAGAPSTFPASRSTAWTYAPSRPRAKACEMVPRGQRPYILEMLTYRYRGHSMSDPASTAQGGGRQDAHGARSDRAGAQPLVEDGASRTRTALKKIDAQVRATVNEAAEFATKDAEPDPSELWTDVYAVETWPCSHHRAYLALAGALASWIAGAWFYCARLRSLAPRAATQLTWSPWLLPLPPGRSRSAGSRAPRPHAGHVNKALVAFIACLDGAVAATSVATNLARVSR
jgi:TPP-dependent pyruvate/acetoin dehydrogenase alpha subunit